MSTKQPPVRKFKVITPEQKRREARQRLLCNLSICLALALPMVVGGWWWFSSSSPSQLKGPAQWPQASQLVRNLAAPTMVLFVESKQPEAANKLDELDRLVNTNLVSAYVIFDEKQPEPLLLERARRLPNTRVVIDSQQQEAEQFLTKSAGDCLLFDRSGRLRFNGDLAKSGEQANQNLSLLTSTPATTPVASRNHATAAAQE
ncbi:MAG: hypothetical protein ACKO0N_17785 [Planctomycetota bacterium]